MPNTTIPPDGRDFKCPCGWTFLQSCEHGAMVVCPKCRRPSFSPDQPEAA